MAKKHKKKSSNNKNSYSYTAPGAAIKYDIPSTGFNFNVSSAGGKAISFDSDSMFVAVDPHHSSFATKELLMPEYKMKNFDGYVYHAESIDKNSLPSRNGSGEKYTFSLEKESKKLRPQTVSNAKAVPQKEAAEEAARLIAKNLEEFDSRAATKAADTLNGAGKNAANDIAKKAAGESDKLLSKLGKYVPAAIGFGATAWLVNKLSDTRGQQTNAQLYGQQQYY